MNKIDKLAATLKSAGEDKKTSAYDTSAKVVRVEGNTAYVNIPGGVAETPASMVVNAKAGEEVRVRVSGGKAYVTGNATSPPTDDSLAQKAENNAIRAQNAAENATRDAKTAKTSADTAVRDAAIAKQSADSAVEDAARAHEAADSAQASATAANTAAQEAKADAQTANEAANNALRGLSTVEDVVDVLTWITEHGIMTSQAGGTFVDGQVYFIVDPNGDYEVGGTRYSVVQNPVASDINNYYILSVDEAVTNYVATHIAVDAEGLWIIPDANNANRVLIATGAGSQYTTAGTYIIGTGGAILAQFTASNVQIKKDSTHYAKIDSNGMNVYSGSSSNSVASFGSTARIGLEASPHLALNSDTIDIYHDASKKVVRIGNYITGSLGVEGLNMVEGYDTDGNKAVELGWDYEAGPYLASVTNLPLSLYAGDNSGYRVLALNGSSVRISALGSNVIRNYEFKSDGVMEVGRYLDFHISDTGTSDYDARLYANSGQLVSGQAFYVNGALTGTLQTPSGSITTTTGTLVSSVIRRFGQVVQLYLAVKNSNAISAGGNIWQGSWSGVKPVINGTGCGYYSNISINAIIDTGGVMLVRNASGTTLPANSSVGVSIVFITSTT